MIRLLPEDPSSDTFLKQSGLVGTLLPLSQNH